MSHIIASINDAASDRGSSVQMIGIATSILRENKARSADSTDALTVWAAEIINHYSIIKFDAKAKQQLQREGLPPISAGEGTWSSEDPSIASVNSGGLLRAKKSGQTIVRMCSSSRCDSAVVSVGAQPPTETIRNPAANKQIPRRQRP